VPQRQQRRAAQKDWLLARLPGPWIEGAGPRYLPLKIRNVGTMVAGEMKLRIQIDSGSTSSYTSPNQGAQIRNCGQFP